MKTNKTALISISVVILAGLGMGAYRYFTRPIATPSVPIEKAAETLPVNTVNEKEVTLYRIIPAESKVSFVIGEILRGAPFTAIGVTNQIAGDISVSLTGITIGTIKVDARTFKTDDPRRDGAIGRFILKSETPENEFITFKPSGIIEQSTDMIENAGMQFTVNGDLTIAGITKPTTFKVAIKKTGDTLAGIASTTIKRSDFGLNIPNIPFVASVDETFPVSISVTAKQVQ